MVTLWKLTHEIMKINYKLLAGVAVILYMLGTTYCNMQLREEVSRVTGNQTTLLEQVEGLKKETQLVLTPGEFKQTLDSSTTAMMKEIDIKVKNVENQVKASSHSEGTISFVPRDTFLIRNDTLIPASTFAHTEKFLTMRGVVMKDSGSVTWETWDSINMLLYWKREGKFIPKIFGKKVYEGAIKGINPYTDYKINKNIKVQKR